MRPKTIKTLKENLNNTTHYRGMVKDFILKHEKQWKQIDKCDLINPKSLCTAKENMNSVNWQQRKC